MVQATYLPGEFIRKGVDVLTSPTPEGGKNKLRST